MDNENIMKTGTTTVGILCKDGIVLAADKRATSGYLVSSKKIDKIHKVTENIAVTMAGTASDAQLLIRYAQSELRLKKIRSNKEATVKEAANLIGRMVYSNIRKMSMIPGISHFILGGIDPTGFYLYDLYADGSITEVDDYISSGSGSVMAFGVLDTLYKKDMSIDEGIELALKAINAALQRDIATGNGFDVITVTKDGAKKVIEKELDMHIRL
jgi:proteasome beta subunit